jgi:hypothetical protein
VAASLNEPSESFVLVHVPDKDGADSSVPPPVHWIVMLPLDIAADVIRGPG